MCGFNYADVTDHGLGGYSLLSRCDLVSGWDSE